MIILQTENDFNRRITECFAIGSNSPCVQVGEFDSSYTGTVVSYGILRGAGEILKNSKSFYYIDHGYFGSVQRKFKKEKAVIQSLSGYFRVVKNDLIHDGNGNYDKKRIDKFNLEFKKIRTSGEFIILSEPSKFITDYLNLQNWTQKTIKEISKYTDRKIFVHNKQSTVPLDELLKHAWAFVSVQSTAGFKAMTQGVPAHFTYNKLKSINSIEEIEKGKIDYQIFNNLAYGQWTMEEMRSGEMMGYL